MDADLSHLDPEDAAEVQRILSNGNISHGPGDETAIGEGDYEEPEPQEVVRNDANPIL